MKRKIAFLGLAILVISIIFSKEIIFSQQREESLPSLAFTDTPQLPVNLGQDLSLNLEPGEEFDLYIFLHPGGEQIVAADIEINFDPQVLEVLEKKEAGIFAGYPEPVGGYLDQASGKIFLSGLAFDSESGQPTTPVSEPGELASLRMKIKDNVAAQTSQIIFSPADVDSQNNLTTDTNLISLSSGEPKDVLSQVNSVRLVIDQPLPPNLRANFSLSPSQESYFLGDEPVVEVFLDTWNNPVVAADLVLHFDPAVWEVKEIIEGAIFTHYPGRTIDNDEGVVKFSGTVGTPGEFFSGHGLFARIIFAIKQVGSAQLELAFTPDSPTTDGNIINESGQDLFSQTPLDGQYEFIFEPVLNFKYSLPDRLEAVGNQAQVEIYSDDQSFRQTIEVDESGIAEGLSLKDLVLNQVLQLVIKVEGYLNKKADEEIVLYGGSNPRQGYLDFGALEAGDLNNDSIVNNLDLAELFDSYYEDGPADFNGDQTVNGLDFSILLANFFKEAQL